MKKLINSILVVIAALLFLVVSIIAVTELNNEQPSDYLFALTLLVGIILLLVLALSHEPKGKNDNLTILDDWEL